MKPEAIIFDMDGLLVDSEIIWHEAETAMIEARGFTYTDDVRTNVIGKRLDEFMTYLRNHYGLEETVEVLNQELVERFITLIPLKVQAKPGAPEIIRYVHEHQIPHAIASSSPQIIIDAIVEAQGWLDIFEVRCTADDVARGKPAPDVYLAAASALGIEPQNCLALEDSPAGSTAAVAAGMTCYAVPDLSHSSIDAFKDITPHVFINLHEVLTVLQNGSSR